MIFFKKNERNFEHRINMAVFPALQGGPHEHQIGALCNQLKYVKTPEFKEYIIQVKKNARIMANEFIRKGYKICTDGTDNHLILLDLNNKNITGSKIEKISVNCLIHIICNRPLASSKLEQVIRDIPFYFRKDAINVW